jgi:hypothetical protein
VGPTRRRVALEDAEVVVPLGTKGNPVSLFLHDAESEGLQCRLVEPAARSEVANDEQHVVYDRRTRWHERSLRLEDELDEEIGDEHDEADDQHDDDYLEREPPSRIDASVFIVL